MSTCRKSSTAGAQSADGPKLVAFLSHWSSPPRPAGGRGDRNKTRRGRTRPSCQRRYGRYARSRSRSGPLAARHLAFATADGKLSDTPQAPQTARREAAVSAKITPRPMRRCATSISSDWCALGEQGPCRFDTKTTFRLIANARRSRRVLPGRSRFRTRHRGLEVSACYVPLAHSNGWRPACGGERTARTVSGPPQLS